MIAGALRELVCRANVALAETGLVLGTFGNVSGVDRDAGVMVIKPSGVPYERLTPEMMVAVSLATGAVIEDTAIQRGAIEGGAIEGIAIARAAIEGAAFEGAAFEGGALRPSSDTPTHLELYRAFPCGGIVHTHSESATALAQARLPVRCMGTTHADYFRGDIPVTRPMREEEVRDAYEAHTGLVIVETFRTAGIAPEEVPAVLVANHGPFAWGPDPFAAIEHARVLEFLARLEITVRLTAPDAPRPASFLIDTHYLRKHGPAAYYGQPKPRRP